MSKRVCMLLNNPFTHDNRVRREAQALATVGYDVTIFCLQGKGLPKQEVRDGFQVVRFMEKHLKVHKILNKGALQYAFHLIRCYPKFDAVHVHDANMLLCGWLIARFWQAKLVYDSHEYWDSIFEEKKAVFRAKTRQTPRQVRRNIKHIDDSKRFECWMLPRCDAIIMVCDSLLEMLRQKVSSRKTRFVTIRNACERSGAERGTLFHQEYQLPINAKVLLYQGRVAHERGVLSVMDALEQISLANLYFVLLGDFDQTTNFKTLCSERVQQSDKLKGRVFFKPAVPPEELLQWTASADAGISPILKLNDTRYYCLPNKIFEYVQAGIPLLVSDFPEMARVVNEYQIGYSFDPEQPGQIAQAIRAVLEPTDRLRDLEANLNRAKAELCWEREQEKLISLYRDLLN